MGVASIPHCCGTACALTARFHHCRPVSLERTGLRLCHFCCPLRRRMRDEQNPRGICSLLASLRSRASRRAGVTCHPWKRETGNETLRKVHGPSVEGSFHAMMVRHPVSSLSNGARTFLIQHRFRGGRTGPRDASVGPVPPGKGAGRDRPLTSAVRRLPQRLGNCQGLRSPGTVWCALGNEAI